MTRRHCAYRGACALVAACCAIACGRSRARESAAREEAYRLNNIGVAHLEQYDYRGAADAFRRAQSVDGSLALPRLNLAIALYYDNQPDAAEREARAATALAPAAPQPHYILGLVARATGRAGEAAERFRRVLAIDKDDAGAKIQLGQVLLDERQFPQATALFEEASRAEPFNATAAYGLATAFTRAGRSDEGRTAMARFQQLRDDPAAFTYASEYLAQGRYAEAIVSTGLEPGLVDHAVPDVHFEAGESISTAVRSVTLADVDGDGQLDLLEATDRGVEVWRNDRGAYRAWRRLEIDGTKPLGVVAGDYDNDGRPDLFVLGDRGDRLLHQETDGTFRDVTKETGLDAIALPARTAAFVDVDHDGDLDIVIGAASGGIRLLRNDGNGRFTDASAESRMATADVHAVALVPADFDNDRDVDLFAAADGAAPVLFSNMRDGTFRDVAADVGLPGAAKYTAVAAADVNKDGAIDFFLGRAGQPGLFVMSGREGRFTTRPAPAETRDATAAQFVDYDNDGVLDLLAITPSGPRLWRNVGDGWVDVSDRALRSLPGEGERAIAMALGDIDGDGDIDVVALLASGRVRVWTNAGGNRRPSLRVRLMSRVSNRSALGAKVEMAAGSLRQKIETSATTPAVAPADIVFGLGGRARPDVVRVLWPAGIVQAETEIAPGSISITELNRKPSSCPFLFTWNGSRFEFITDFMGGGEMGAWTAPGERSVPDPVEYVRIPRGQLAPRDGRLELRVTNELEEALFIDRLQLVAVAHPSGVDVFPSSGLRSPSERRPFELFTVSAPHPPRQATDDRGRDVLDRLAAVDRRAVDGFDLESIQGYAREHTLTIDLGDTPPGSRVRLLLTGWTDYAFSSDNAAAHQAGLVFVPPALQVRDENGGWRTAISEIGLPTGRPQTVVVDVTKALAGQRTAQRSASGNEVRIVSTARVYWDQILVDTSAPSPFVATPLRAVEATLRRRGYSAELASPGVALPTYDYSRVSIAAPWKTMTGRYTRLGDVRALVEASDDRFVVSAPGDEIALAFDAAALPPLPGGWERTFLLHADGFSKEMNLRSASPDRVEPLPFHGMSRYPYSASEHYPRTPEHDRYRSTFNTRIIGRPLPTLEQTMLQQLSLWSVR